MLGSYAGKVDRWHNSDRILRWTGMGLMDIEPRLNRIQGHRYLKILRYKLQEIIGQRLHKDPEADETKIEKASLVEAA